MYLSISGKKQYQDTYLITDNPINLDSTPSLKHLLKGSNTLTVLMTSIDVKHLQNFAVVTTF